MKKIVFLVGESGCGKTYLQENLIKHYPELFTRIISTTTRKPREKEVDKIHYHFTSELHFQDLHYKEELVQSVKFGANRYGTQITEYIQEQDIGIFVCTPEGINDTIEALEEKGIVYEYEIVFFMTTNSLLFKHGVDKERIMRGEIRLNFMDRMNRNQFNNIRTAILVDHHINDDLYKVIKEYMI